MSFQTVVDVLSFLAPVGIVGAAVLALPFLAALVLWAFPRAAVSLFAREDPQKLLEELLAEEEKEKMRAAHVTRKPAATPKKAAATMRLVQEPAAAIEVAPDSQAASCESVTEPIAVSSTAKPDDLLPQEHEKTHPAPFDSVDVAEAAVLAVLSVSMDADNTTSASTVSVPIVPNASAGLATTTPVATAAAAEIDTIEHESVDITVNSAAVPQSSESDGWNRVVPRQEEVLSVLRERVQSLKAALEKSEDEALAARAAAARDAARASELDKELRERMRQSRHRISELEDDITSLRAAKKTLSERVIELESDTSSAASLAEQVEVLKTKLTAETEAAKSAQAMADELKQEVESKTSRIAALDATVASLEAESTKTSLALTKAKAELQSKCMQLADMEKRLSETQNTMTIQAHGVDSLKFTIAGLESDNEILKKKSLDKEKKLASALDDIEKLSAALAKMTEERDEAHTKAADLEKLVEDLKANVASSTDSAKVELAAANEQIVELKNAVERLTNERDTVKSELAQAESLNNEHEQGRAEAQRLHTEAEEKCKHQSVQLASLSSELESARATIASIEASQAELSATIESHKQAVNEDREKLLRDLKVELEDELQAKFDGQVEEYKKTIADLEANLAQLSAANAELNQGSAQESDASAIESMMREIEESKALRQEIVAELEAAKQDLKNAVAERNAVAADLQSKVAQMRAENASETERLQKDVAAHLEMIQTLRTELVNSSRRISIMETTSARRRDLDRQDNEALAAERDELQSRLARAEAELEALRAEAERVAQLGAEIVQESAAER